MINIFYSQTLTGCEPEIFNKLKNLRDGKTMHVIFTPDRRTLIVEEQLFNYLNTTSIFDVNVTTLTRFTNIQLQNRSYNFKVLTKPLAVSIIKKILYENESNFKTIKKAIKFNGFSETLFDTISMFKSCGVNYKNINSNYKNKNLNYKLQDIKLVYEKYEEFLQNDWTDSFNKINLLNKLIDKEMCKTTHFYFIGFDDFTPEIYEVIKSLSKFALSVNVATSVGYIDSIHNKNIFLNNVYLNLLDIAKIENIKVNKIYCPLKISNNFIPLANNLFGYKIETSKIETNKIQLYKFNNKTDEIEFAIKCILKLVNNGVNFSEIVVIVPSINDYKDMLSLEMQKNGITGFFDVSEPITNNIVTRFYFDLFNLILKNISVKDLFDFLCNYTNINSVLLSEFFNEINKLGLNFINSIPHSLDATKFDNILNLLNIIQNLVKNLKSLNYFKDYILEINNFIESFGFTNFINELNETYKKNNNIIEQRKLIQVTHKVKQGLNNLVDVLGDYSCIIFDCFGIIKSYFENITIVIPPIINNSVFVADLVNSYVPSKQYALFLGCSEGNMPVLQSDLGLISDSDINEIKKDIRLTPTINLINKKNKLKVYEKLLNFNNLYLSYVCLNSNNEKVMFSEAIKNMLAIYNVSINNGSMLLENTLSVQNNANFAFNNSSSNFVVSNFLHMLKSADAEYNNQKFLLGLTTLYNVTKNLNYDASSYLKNLKFINKTDNVNAKNLFFNNNEVSASEIETYYNCPYKYFVEYGLRLNKEETSEISSLDVGNILHEYVKIILPKIINNNLTLDKCNEIGNKILDEILNKSKYNLLKNNSKNANDIKSLKTEIARINEALIKIESLSNFKTNEKMLEMPFIESLPVKVNGKYIKIKGVIDRVDVLNNEFRIVDYKTGNSEFSDFSEMAAGKKIQLIVYLSAIKNKLNFEPVGAFYLPLKNTYSKNDKTTNYKLTGILKDNLNTILNMDCSLKKENITSSVLNLKTDKTGTVKGGLLIKKEDFEYLINYVLNLIEKAVNCIMAGEIEPKPLRMDKKTTCDFCKYLGMCKFSEQFNNSFNEVKSIKTVEELRKNFE